VIASFFRAKAGAVGICVALSAMPAIGAAAAPSGDPSPDGVAVAAIRVPESDVNRKLAEVVWAGVRNALTRPTSGVVVLRGISLGDRHFAVTNTFDQGGEMARTDTETKDGPVHSITNADATYFMRGGTGTITHYSRYGDESLHSPYPVPIDWRLLGVCSSLEIAMRDDVHRFEAKVINAGANFAVADAGGYRFMSQFKAPTYTMVRVMWIGHDFLPMRAEVWTYINHAGKWRHESTTSVKRAVVNGATVPLVATTIDQRRNTSSSIKCEWKSVDERVDPALFEVAGLGAPAGTVLADARGPVPTVESVLGSRNRTAPLGRPRDMWRTALIFINVLAVAAIAYLVWRRRARHAKA
jgi:hypothetical protein